MFFRVKTFSQGILIKLQKCFCLHQEGETVPECHVCMCEYEENDQIRILTCFHSFHSQCIDKWIKVILYILVLNIKDVLCHGTQSNFIPVPLKTLLLLQVNGIWRVVFKDDQKDYILVAH